ncbi:MAG: cellulose binding domain-containing protein [Micromonosporaceae bacterium]|nr:cellulose binding domain-containing protein [Micromonosporaceae bacterium]
MRQRARRGVVVAATLAVASGLTVVAVTQASAAAGCTVAYTTSQWPGGFTANVAITNLGDPLTSWKLEWDFANGQTVTQGWNGTFAQSGAHVTVANAAYNGGVATNATVTPGFNGTWTGANTSPTAFTLNGVACTGATTSQPATTQPSTAAPTAQPSTAAPTTSAPSSSAGVPSDAAWVATGAWDSWTNNGYTIINDIWGSGAGAQTIWARTGTNWGVVASHPSTSGVKSYPHNAKTLNRALSSVGSLTSTVNVTVPNSGAYATAYDIWANNNAYEVMIWMNQYGAVGPIAESYDANGTVPSAANISVGGHTWNVYKGSNGSNAVFSFIRTSNTTSGTVDVLAVLNWLRTNSWWGDVTVGEVQFGFELTSTSSNAGFTCTSCTINYN